MRSYWAHLETGIPTNQNAIIPKPIFRSSAIFPMLHFNGISSRILFMGYWILKRNIKEIAAVITLRSDQGKVLHRSTMSILEPKTYRVELKDQLIACGIDLNGLFLGSMEIEFFSTQNLVFPFPAVVINYYGPNFSSVVHTAQRIFNDFDDMRNNSQTEVPESGFNIYADDNQEPFIGLINGAEEVPEAIINLEIYNSKKETMHCEIDLGRLAPYQAEIIYPAQECKNLREFLGGTVGAAKLHFKVKWIFPRLVVGNMMRSPPAVTITHTYYDCTHATADSDYWRPTEEAWYPATLMLPVSIQEKHFTKVYFYPIYSPSTFSIDAEIFDSKGTLLGRKQDVAILISPSKEYNIIEVKALCNELGISPQRDLAIRIIARNDVGQRIPARIKLGFDVGSSLEKMPCNICTNLQPFNPKLEEKPKSFRWSPLLTDRENASLWLMNSSPSKNYSKEALVELTFFREKDTQTKAIQFSIAPHGFHVIRPDENLELKEFFGNQIGWMTATSTNPYTSSYYFTENASGVMGGDHGF